MSRIIRWAFAVTVIAIGGFQAYQYLNAPSQELKALEDAEAEIAKLREAMANKNRQRDTVLNEVQIESELNVARNAKIRTCMSQMNKTLQECRELVSKEQ